MEESTSSNAPMHKSKPPEASSSIPMRAAPSRKWGMNKPEPEGRRLDWGLFEGGCFPGKVWGGILRTEDLDIFSGVEEKNIDKGVDAGVKKVTAAIKRRKKLSVPPKLMTVDNQGGFREIGREEALRIHEEAMEKGHPAPVFRGETGPSGETIILPSIENRLANLLLNKQREFRNAEFYLFSDRARKGMDEAIWPPLLREALEAERWWVGKLIRAIGEKKSGRGTFLECGAGDGRTMLQEYRIRKNGAAFRLFEHFDHVMGVDFSWQMLHGASKEIARMLGMDAIQRTRFILGELSDMHYIAPASADLVVSLFNTPGNMTSDGAKRMLSEINRILKEFDYAEGSQNPPPLFFATVYREKEETIKTQEEFYSGMGLRVERVGDGYTRAVAKNSGNGEGMALRSKRFTEEKITGIVGESGLELLRVFPISTIMWGVLAVSSHGTHGGPEEGERVKNELLQRTGLQKEIDAAWGIREGQERWDWSECL